MAELKQSWAVAALTPYDIYMKTLYMLVHDRLEEAQQESFLWSDDITAQLADFQRVAVRQAIQTIGRYNGCFVSDVVGLGKSYIGAAIVKHFERVERARPLIICPKPLLSMWERYNEIYQLNAHVLSMSLLREEDDGGSVLLNDVKYKDRDFVLVDESHNFRNPDLQRYRVLQHYLEQGRKCVLLTATPRTRNAWDIYNQMRLFHSGDITTLPIDPPNLRQYFDYVENGERSLPELLSNILIRRTRSHILRWYGYDAETGERLSDANIADYRANRRRAYVDVGGRRQMFPRRELQTAEYSIEDTYLGLYDRLRVAMGRSANDPEQLGNDLALRYARYGLWQYVHKNKQKQAPYMELHRAGANLRGLMRAMLFKRFESSVYAFRETLRRMIATHQAFLAALDNSIVPAGEDAAAILHEADTYDEAGFIDALRSVGQRYDVRDFRVAALRDDVTHDVGVLKTMLAMVEPITPKRDAKLQRLKALLAARAANQKVLIFTQYADTARYLFNDLNPDKLNASIEVIYSNDRDKARIVARFSPGSNREIQLRSTDTPINTLIATDVLSEGLNLQDCDTVINYDLHWNPVRLIQRFGRIDRIGTEYSTIYGINFLPERSLERNLGLHEVLRRRIREIHETIGEDAAVLEPSEKLNERAMYAIYTGEHAEELEDAEDDGMLGLNEAEELLRQLREDDPAEYDRIAHLRNGIRSGRASSTKGRMVFCQSGDYQQLMLVDHAGQTITRDVPAILKVLRCSKDEPTLPIDSMHNRIVSQAKAQFTTEAWQRRMEQQRTESLTTAQRYILKEMRTVYAQLIDEDLKAQITVLERAFRQSLTRSLASEVNALKRAGMMGLPLVQELSHLYTRYQLDQQRAQKQSDDNTFMPYIVCSEVLM